MSLLELRHINVRFGDMEALIDVSLEVEARQIVALLGANGAGKTTTMRAISGLAQPSNGVIMFNGQRIDTQPAHCLVELGLAHVPEERHLFPGMSVSENLLMGAYCRLAWRKRHCQLEHVFDLFPALREHRKQLASTLSGGEQQLLAIGRALMAGPQLLLLDEPSLGLSPALVDEVFASLDKIRHQYGVAILLAEQNAAVALRAADKGYVLEAGRVVLSGSCCNLLGAVQLRRAYLGH